MRRRASAAEKISAGGTRTAAEVTPAVTAASITTEAGTSSGNPYFAGSIKTDAGRVVAQQRPAPVSLGHDKVD